MSITYTLPGFPVVNQLHEPTVDGYPDENADWNCVPASLAAGLTYLTGKPFDGDQLHDTVYGQGYRGAQSARDYITYCARQGATLAPFDSAAGVALVARIHQELLAGHPVVLTMPSQWGIPPADPLHPSGTTHVGIACGYGPGAIRVMNPWGGFWHDGDDSYWRVRLCYGEVWILSKTQGATTMALPSGWKDNGKVLIAPNGHMVDLGFRDYILSHPWAADDQPIEEEHGVASVLHEDGRWGGGTRILFVRSGLFWAPTPDKALASGPVLGEVPMGLELRSVERSLDDANAALARRDADLAAARAQIDALNARIAELEKQLAGGTNGAAPDPAATASKSALVAIKAALARLP